ncbi:MAG: hypothetical protein KBB94_06100 [Legionellaceae bacterium]|nr:hypothetical protein [Legionellaceae bacterium]MBP9775904.1 hypothetical protein [Legionellaceae bacterium]
MQQPLDTLQEQLEIVEQFENLFNVNNDSEFKKKLGTSNADGTFMHFMGDTAEEKCRLAFSSPTATSPTRPADNLAEAITCLKNFLKIKNPQDSSLLSQVVGSLVGSEDPNAAIFRILDSRENAQRNVTFFDAVISAMLAIGKYKEGSEGLTAIQALFSATSKLIQTQKEAVQHAIQAVETSLAEQTAKEKIVKTVSSAIIVSKFAKSPQMKKRVKETRDNEAAKTIAEQHSALEAKKQFRKKCARYTGAAVLATGGTAAIALSTLMQFGPQFAMLASLNLPPVALAAIAISGVAMLAAAAYVTYRTYKPAHAASVDTTSDAPVVTNPAAGYSKFLTPVLTTVGLGLVGFSALVQFSPSLMQFSPTFALLMGLHLTPAALMSVAAVGVLLLSVSLYRACKAYAQSRADATAETVVVNAEATEPTNTTCMQRLSQYTNCCFKLFSRSTTAARSSTDTSDLGAVHSAKV